MAYEIGYVDSTGSEGVAHWQMLLKIKTLAEANGWTTLRYTTPTDGSSRELILKGAGLSGTAEIFIGFRTYHDVNADYYNLAAAGFTGYVASNAWAAQPGMRESGIPAHNQRIDYWLQINAQRINLALQVGSPASVFESGGAGFFLPYATPGQYPYPLYVAGMLNGAQPIRYSDTAHSMAWKGGRPNLAIRWMDGSWKTPASYPWNSPYVGGASAQLRDTNGQYPITPVILCEATPNVFGELDGIGYVSNFNNTVLSTVSDGAVDWLCVQDVARVGFNDYFAMRMS